MCGLNYYYYQLFLLDSPTVPKNISYLGMEEINVSLNVSKLTMKVE